MSNMEVETSVQQQQSSNNGIGNNNPRGARHDREEEVLKDYLNNQDEILNHLAESTLSLYRTHAPTHRLLVGIAGVPGSGKTTLARNVVERINLLTQKQLGVTIATVLSMDGYHYSRTELDGMSDPAEAHRRRGAPFTFDVEALKALLESLREPVLKEGEKDAQILYASSFDHAVKDPVKDDIAILPTHRIIIAEGNYLCFSPPPSASISSADWTHPSPKWAKIAPLFHRSWFIETPASVVRERLAKRHLEAGIVKAMEEAQERAGGSDLRNADDILRWKIRPDITIIS